MHISELNGDGELGNLEGKLIFENNYSLDIGSLLEKIELDEETLMSENSLYFLPIQGNGGLHSGMGERGLFLEPYEDGFIRVGYMLHLGKSNDPGAKKENPFWRSNGEQDIFIY